MIIQPALWFFGVRVGDLCRGILVPVIRLGRIGVNNLGVIHPVFRLLVCGVVNLLWGVHRGVEVGEEGSSLGLFSVDEDAEGVVRTDDECVEVGQAVGFDSRGVLHVLLFPFQALGVLVSKDEVDLVGGAALVGAKHDRIAGGGGETISGELLTVEKKLQVRATTLKAFSEPDFVLENKGAVLADAEGAIREWSGDSVLLGRVKEAQGMITRDSTLIIVSAAIESLTGVVTVGALDEHSVSKHVGFEGDEQRRLLRGIESRA